MSLSDGVAFGIVGATAIYVARAPFRLLIAAPLSAFLLRRGKVKLAMRVRKLAGLFRAPSRDCH